MAVRGVAQDFKSSLSFNGTGGNSIAIGTLPTALNGLTNQSVAFWYYPVLTGSSQTIYATGFTGTGCFEIRYGAVGNILVVKNGVTVMLNNTAKIIPRNTWNHFVVTYNATSGLLNQYLNGSLYDTATSVQTFTNNDYVIGKKAGDLNGKLARFRIYNRELSASEVLDTYTTGRQLSGIALAYNLQEGAGTTATDTSGNANNGTITGATYSADVPSTKRKLIGDNLVRNGNFSYIPAFTAATSTISTWIDGSAAGTALGSTQRGLFGWGFLSGASAQFDDGGIKVTAATGTIAEVSNVSANTASQILALNMKLEPSTSYSVTYRMRTELTGDSADGARLIFTENLGTGGTNVTNNGTAVKGTTGWTSYSITVTTSATTRYGRIRLAIIGNSGAATLAGSAWFDDITLTPTVNPISRPVVQNLRSSLQFNGTSSGVVGTSTVNAFATAGTLSAWVKFNTTAANQAVIGTTLNNAGMAIIHRAGGIRVEGGNGTGTIGTTVLPLQRGIWYHLAGVFNGANLFMYVNGQMVSMSPSITTIADPIRALTLGKGAGGAFDYMGGSIANAKAWSTALTADQIMAIYTSEQTPTTGLITTWKLDEGAGTTATDSSGNANNGTITAGTYSADVPTKARQLVGGNLVKNGDFEYSPPFVAAQTTTSSGLWIDGTAAGSTTNSLFNWGLIRAGVGATSIQFDNTVKFSGTNSLKLSVTTANVSLVASTATIINATTIQTVGIPVSPSTSYTLKYLMKTNYVSGDSTGAYMQIQERNASSATTVATAGTAVKTTIDWTQYTVTVITSATTRYIEIQGKILANVAPATLLMDAWFDDITLTPTTNTTRQIA